MWIEKKPGEDQEVVEQERDDREQRPDQADASSCGCPARDRVQQRVHGDTFVGELGDDPPVAQDRDLVAQPEHLFDLGRDEEHRHAVFAQRDDQTLDLGLRANVDAPGRLVEDMP